MFRVVGHSLVGHSACTFFWDQALIFMSGSLCIWRRCRLKNKGFFFLGGLIPIGFWCNRSQKVRKNSQNIETKILQASAFQTSYECKSVMCRVMCKTYFERQIVLKTSKYIHKNLKQKTSRNPVIFVNLCNIFKISMIMLYISYKKVTKYNL